MIDTIIDTRQYDWPHDWHETLWLTSWLTPDTMIDTYLMLLGPGLQVVAHVPVAGPVPPPNKVVIPAAIASFASWGQMKWTWQSRAPAVSTRPSPATTSVPTPMVKPYQRTRLLYLLVPGSAWEIQGNVMWRDKTSNYLRTTFIRLLRTVST